MKKLYMLLAGALLWATAGFSQGADCSDPVVIDFDTDLPYVETGGSNCGLLDDYDATCLGNYDSGEDIVYRFDVATETTVLITFDPNGTSWTGIALFDACPDVGTCISFVTGSSSTTGKVIQETLAPGTYYFMIDTWSTPDCVPDYNLNIEALTCLPVTNLTVLAGTTSALVSWSQDANSIWDIAVDTTGFDITSATITTVTDTIFAASNLMQGGFYDVYVRANCGAGEVSGWAMTTFKTVEIGDNCDFPIEVDFATDVPFEDLNQTTCGRGNFYDQTCLDNYDNGEDIIYKLTVDGLYNVSIAMDPKGQKWGGIAVFDDCPDVGNCMDFIQYGSNGNIDSLNVQLDAGTYYVMVDIWPPPTCFEFDLYITADAVSCPNVTGLEVTDLTATEATIFWNGDGNTSWDIVIDTAGFDPNLVDVVTIADTSVSLLILEPETSYDVYVRTNCGGGSVSDWVMISFTTPCVFVTEIIPYSENFEGVTVPEMPCNWIVDNFNGDNYTWVTRLNNANTSLYIRWNSAMDMDDLVRTPKLALISGTPYTLKFDLRTSSSSFVENLAVILYDSLGNQLDTLMNFVEYANTDWVTNAVDFTPDNDGAYRIGFYGYSVADQFGIYVDNIEVMETPDCPAPIAVTVEDITSVSATANWDNVGENYQIVWDTAGFDPTSVIAVSVSDTTYEIMGLLPLTDYEVYVRQDCGGGTYSTWTGTTFTTLNTPPANDNACDATDITVDGDTVFVDNTWATQDGPGGSCWGNNNNGDVWLKFEFTPTDTTNGVEVVTAAGTSDDSHIAIFKVEGCPGDTLTFTEIACDEDGGEGFMSYIGPTLLEAGTYYIACATWTGTEGSYGVAINSVNVSPAPDNDNCDGAVTVDVTVGGDMVTVTGDATGATDGAGFGVAQVWESFTIDNCADVVIDFCESDPAAIALFNIIFDSCPIGDPAVQNAPVTAADCGDGNLAVTFTNLEPGTYWYPIIADIPNFEGFAAYTMNVTAMECTIPGDTCYTWLGGPWINFNTEFGGAPQPDAEGNCETYEITGFQVWASESYVVENFQEGVQYTWSICNGDYGAWPAELSVVDTNGVMVAWAADTCAVSWVPEYTGTYYLGVNEYGACGNLSDNLQTDNGYPAITCNGAVGIEEITNAGLAIYPNPNSGVFTFSNNNVAGDYLLEVVDITGKVVYSDKLYMASGEQREISADNVKMGVYMVRVTNVAENFTHTLRMIIK